MKIKRKRLSVHEMYLPKTGYSWEKATEEELGITSGTQLPCNTVLVKDLTTAKRRCLGKFVTVSYTHLRAHET